MDILGRSPMVFAALLFGVSSEPLVAQPAEAAALEAHDAPREAQTCLDQPTIKRTRVLNDRNIIFVTRDNAVYNNNLPKDCPSLRRGGLVRYPVEQRRLCAGGNFQVLWQAGGANDYIPAFVCQLGYFVPISESELEDLTAATEENRERRPRGRSRREAVQTENVELPPAGAAQSVTEETSTHSVDAASAPAEAITQ